MKDLSLSEFYFVVGERFPEKSFFESIMTTLNLGEQIGDSTFFRIHKIDIDETIVGIDIRFGDNDEYSEDVILSGSRKITHNPKTREMVEPKNQVLVFYVLSDIDRGSLWISNSRFLGMLRKIFSLKTNIEEDKIEMKRVYTDVDDFMEKLSSLKSVRFTALPDNLMQDNDLREALPNIFGLDGVKRYKLEADLNRDNRLSFQNRNVLKKLAKDRTEYGLEKLIIAGKGTDGRQMVLNNDYFGARINIKVEKDENGFYSYEEVKKEFKNKLHISDD